MSDRQHTLAKPASIEGTSLHTGEKVTLTLQPAPENFGFKFRRMDIEDKPLIDASIDKVQKVERATTIADGGVNVHTVEHVLSALIGMGVDNAIIEMDAQEPPIVDGSSLPFVQLIKQAGIAEQSERRRVFEVREPIHIESRDGSLLTVVPDKKFRISCTNVGPQGRATQFYSTEITPDIYEKEIAPARTFTFYEDIAHLMEKGLIKGGTLESAIVIRGETAWTKHPLRFAEEFVRHKILDIVGDLSLLGRRILGHVIAVRPGHGPNAELTRALSKSYNEMRAMVPVPFNLPSGDAVLDVNEVMRILPHRYPFLLVDRIIGFEGENKCTGVKNVTINEPFFQGHFPGHPVMPGVLQLEAMAQVASILLLRTPGNQGKIGYFMSADNVKWRRPVMPGDTLLIEAELLKVKRSVGQARGRCVVNGQVVSEADLMFSLLDR
ncbi:bifunctional UDP-3-O-[3-hydroxymyristoyl] N-acetylglucosamine deacetylase/3-hydroxyacyl-ACP dehydratase [Roseimicrobium sp. ORNL1]|uniref:bifunctional UDP-3-O-[3-hydroxymyristoyl] N-acetylglucosamine deacetylase/3-hydroxyacyl-ACP dehydratase n=1 Tax=Roseimicrobium sp. ORNL1 TaxID=2711231 RepID=UPI0013E1F50D|nr:bifunctional UDP-3-O-[3-hydroxymyristoyl] N-acetylglucosamine deacetylase/3-hydroxyacyl-ACP dehydratase [Roseimicrobium sp. ORNL1]QIF04847.1 bifunctional UDP-3-O-[3-hydroxymyristoyl] N-acetylglucosamine deacetylase/3-hydroxyacyl-ACP dehydratase [Roseimicrobium sp. ORNL1]